MNSEHIEALRKFTCMPGKSFDAAIPPLTERQNQYKARLEQHVKTLAEDIGIRHAARPQSIASTIEYIRSTLNSTGYETRTQQFDLTGESAHNLEALLPGRKGDRAIVVGAHYDTVLDSPGADDNASGLAIMLELASLLRGFQPQDSIRFVAFANEEHSQLPKETMGSFHYAHKCKQQDEDVRMIALEMLGYFSWEPASQRYPEPFNHFYPTVGNFVGFIANLQSRQFVDACIGAFRAHAQIPSAGLAAPSELVNDISRSDHWGFWHAGYQAIMITDTSEFRNPHYHKDSDTSDSLDFDAMTHVLFGLAAMLEEISR